MSLSSPVFSFFLYFTSEAILETFYHKTDSPVWLCEPLSTEAKDHPVLERFEITTLNGEIPYKEMVKCPREMWLRLLLFSWLFLLSFLVSCKWQVHNDSPSISGYKRRLACSYLTLTTLSLSLSLFKQSGFQGRGSGRGRRGAVFSLLLTENFPASSFLPSMTNEHRKPTQLSISLKPGCHYLWTNVDPPLHRSTSRIWT